jgi:micrococcal nuclease
MYTYVGKILKVIDGDTCDAQLSLGFDIWVTQRLRLAGIDTPEVKGESRSSGLAAKSFVEDWVIAAGPTVLIKTYKDKSEKYGRYLAEIFHADDQSKSLTADLLSAGMAKPYSGGAR